MLALKFLDTHFLYYIKLKPFHSFKQKFSPLQTFFLYHDHFETGYNAPEETLSFFQPKFI